MGCTFCATGLGGFQRNLTASEMLSQVQAAQKDAGVRISNIVLMGMGEPLDNYNQVIRFLRLVSSQEGMNLACAIFLSPPAGWLTAFTIGGGKPAADPFGFLARSQQCDPQPDHAGEPKISH